MLDNQEKLLNILGEECAELNKEVHKTLRFGLDAYNINDPMQISNREKLICEFNDIVAMMEMLQEIGIFPDMTLIQPQKIADKKQKVINWS